MYNHKPKIETLKMQTKTLKVDWGEDGISNGKQLKGIDLNFGQKKCNYTENRKKNLK